MILLVALSLLAGCASIPTSGPVLPGRPVDTDPRAGVSGVLPDLPSPGASPEAIVSGFLRAAAGFSYDHRVARSFLTPQRRLAWRPDASVKVYPGQLELEIEELGRPKPTATPTSTPTVTPTATPTSTPSPVRPPGPGPGPDGRDRAEVTKVQVTTPIEATIDNDGRYRAAAPGVIETATFGLTRSGGQWRISALTDGILIASIDFGITFRPFPVYFGDPTGRFLVPDLHWFPGTRDEPGSLELPTALVRVLLEGPPAWLRGAVVTGAPPGTRMAVGAVVVADDVATVDLSEEVRLADSRQRQLLASQLLATLDQLRTISAVRITVTRLDFDVPAGAAGGADPSSSQPDSQPVADPKVDGRPVVIDTKGRLARLDGRTLIPVKDVDGLAVRGANRPAVSNDSSAYAVLNGNRSRLLLQLPGTKAVSLVRSSGLTAPSFDPQGWVWTSPGTGAGFVHAVGTDQLAIKVEAPWLTRMDVVSLRISRDGTRAAFAVRVRGRAHVFVSGVVRDAEGEPQALTQPIGLLPDLLTVADLAWVDEDQVVVLGGTTEEPLQQPWVAQIGGTIRDGTLVPSGETVTVGNGIVTLMVGTPDGTLARAGALWRNVSKARWPAYPG